MRDAAGRLLAHYRHNAGLTQTQLAEKLCAVAAKPTLTRNDISRWERGLRLPDEFWLRQLSGLLALPEGTQRFVRAAHSVEKRRRRLAGSSSVRQP